MFLLQPKPELPVCGLRIGVAVLVLHGTASNRNLNLGFQVPLEIIRSQVQSLFKPLDNLDCKTTLKQLAANTALYTYKLKGPYGQQTNSVPTFAGWVSWQLLALLHFLTFLYDMRISIPNVHMAPSISWKCNSFGILHITMQTRYGIVLQANQPASWLS